MIIYDIRPPRRKIVVRGIRTPVFDVPQKISRKFQRISSAILIFLLATPFYLWPVTITHAAATNIYIAQTAAGAGDGTSCANAYAVTFFNTVGNWGSGDGQIGAGTTVHLCGTISTTLATQGSGSSGNPITIIFESSSKLSKTAWGTLASAAIYLTGEDYITIDGNNVGIIESTDNGTGLGTSQQAHGIDIANGSTDIIIKNLTIQNIYVGNSVDGGVTDPNEYGRAIYADNTSNLTINNNTISHGGKIIIYSFRATASNVNIYNNTISNSIVGITVGSAGTGVAEVLDGLNIYNNTISPGTNWNGCWQVTNPCDTWHHQDGIHVFAKQNAGTQVLNARIYNNYIGNSHSVYTSGTVKSDMTAWIYTEGNPGTIISPWIYNNVMVAASGSGINPTNAFHHMKETTGEKFYNNTIYGNGGTAIGIYISSDSSADIQNNIFYDLNNSIQYFGVATAPTADYNVHYSTPTLGYEDELNTSYTTLSNWQTVLGGCPGSGNECNSTTSQPTLDVNYSPTSSDTVAKDLGVDLSAYFTTDKSGVSRPKNLVWDIGAYEYTEAVAPIISNVASTTAATTATITWTTNENATSTVNYGLTGSYGIASSSASYVTSHSITLTGLSSATTYHFQVSSADVYGNVSNSGDYTFTTAAAPDTTPPTVDTYSPTDNATDVAINSNLVLTFNENIAKGTGNILIKKTSDDSTAQTIDVTSGAVTVSGTTVTINPSDFDYSTGYYVNMASGVLTDTATTPNPYAGISNSTTWNFTTAASPDVTAPVRSAGSPSGSQSAGTTQVSLSLTTDENATCKYSASAGTAYGSMTDIFSTTGGTSHSSTITGLSNGNSYSYYVRCTDGSNANSDDYTISFSVASPTSSGGGGGGSPAIWTLPTVPTGGFKVNISSGASVTSNRNIILGFNAGSDIKKMAISMTGDFTDASQEDYTPTKQWDLCSKLGGAVKNPTCPDGTYTVYVKFYTAYGRTSDAATVSSSIVLDSNAINPSTDVTTGTSTNQQSQNQQPFTKHLRYGMYDADVKRLQQFLNLDPDTRLDNKWVGSPGHETNFFGPKTWAAVRRFQEKYGKDVLSPWGLIRGTGYVGKTTLAKINELIIKIIGQ